MKRFVALSSCMMLTVALAVTANASDPIPGLGCSKCQTVTTESQSLSFSITEKGYQVQEVTRTKTQGDFNLANKFSVEIAGRVVGSIISVDGLEHSHETVEYKDPEDQTTRYRPGNNKTTRIKITREWSNDKTFTSWMNNVVKGQTDRRSITVTLLADDGEPTASLNFYECYPVSLDLPSFPNGKSLGSAHAVESFELLCAPILKDQVPPQATDTTQRATN